MDKLQIQKSQPYTIIFIPLGLPSLQYPSWFAFLEILLWFAWFSNWPIYVQQYLRSPFKVRRINAPFPHLLHDGSALGQKYKAFLRSHAEVLAPSPYMRTFCSNVIKCPLQQEYLQGLRFLPQRTDLCIERWAGSIDLITRIGHELTIISKAIKSLFLPTKQPNKPAYLSSSYHPRAGDLTFL